MATRLIATDNADTIGLAATGTTGRKLSERDRVLIETLLQDRGILSSGTNNGPSASPTPAPSNAGTAPQAIAGNPIATLAISTVRPGDLITSGYINSLVEALLSLDRRLAALESEPQPAPTPTPAPSSNSTPTPTPTPAPSGQPPQITNATATVAAGGRVLVEVTGTNITKARVSKVQLGTTTIALSAIRFTRTGFGFATTQTIVTNARGRLTVTTPGGSAGTTLSVER